jgi:hypothetical protein
MAVRTEPRPDLDPVFRLLVLGMGVLPEEGSGVPPTVAHVLRAASLLGYPVLGRSIGLFTRGVPAEIELASGSRPGAVSGFLHYFGQELPEGAVRALGEIARLYALMGDVYRQNIARLLGAALARSAILGPTPIDARGRTVVDLLRQLPHLRR